MIRPRSEIFIMDADNDTAAFAFNVRGQILNGQGKKKEAVLEYLKTLVLFKPGIAPRERQNARQQVVALLKEMNDARWQFFEKVE